MTPLQAQHEVHRKLALGKNYGRTIITSDNEVTIIGAGPYGLSLAAHLAKRKVSYRIVGKPMHAWSNQMPKGMLLKSEAFASNLYDPDGHFTLRRFCDEKAIDYADVGIPIRLDTFVAYGLAFQKRFVPDILNQEIVNICSLPSGFSISLDDGSSFRSRRVVVAVGNCPFEHLPAQLAQLPRELASHSSHHHDLTRFRGERVIVIGAGASAVDMAVLLKESGADVRIVARTLSIECHTKMELPRPLWDRVRAPMSPIGPSWRSRLFTDAPMLFHFLPEAKRLSIVKTYLGPAAGWFMRRGLERIPRVVGCRLTDAGIKNGRPHLELYSDKMGAARIEADHVIAATGYKVDLRRLSFLSQEIHAALKSVEHTPVLSSSFESSIRGLYFVGPAAANSFGPVMRFGAGAAFAAKHLAGHLASRSPGFPESASA